MLAFWVRYRERGGRAEERFQGEQLRLHQKRPVGALAAPQLLRRDPHVGLHSGFLRAAVRQCMAAPGLAVTLVHGLIANFRFRRAAARERGVAKIWQRRGIH